MFSLAHYSLASIAALIAICFAAFLRFEGVEWALLVIPPSSLIALAGVAVHMKRLGTPGFDLAIAAEVVVAGGIASLLLGLAVSGLRAFDDPSFFTGPSVDFAHLTSILRPFFESFVTAGLAPFIASIIRQIDMQLSARSAEFGDLDSALRSATDSVELLRKRVDELGTTIEVTGRSMSTTGGHLKKTGDDVAAISASLVTAVEGIVRHSDRLGTSAEGAKELAEAFMKLKEASEEGTNMLDGLNNLIAAIKRFLPDDGSA